MQYRLSIGSAVTEARYPRTAGGVTGDASSQDPHQEERDCDQQGRLIGGLLVQRSGGRVGQQRLAVAVRMRAAQAEHATVGSGDPGQLDRALADHRQAVDLATHAVARPSVISGWRRRR
jgi:hypothetical protein